MTADKKILQVVNFTDPICTWCLGMEPIFRSIETHYGDAIVIKYVMGGLVRDYREMADPAAGIRSSDAAVFNAQVASHWVEASRRHGMPVKSEGFSLFSDDYPSSYPENIAYEAAKIVDIEKADLFLYRMRVAVSAEGRIISKEEVLCDIAEETGLNREEFQKELTGERAKNLFLEDRKMMFEHHISGFPSFLFLYDGKKYFLNGFLDFETFQKAVSKITKEKISPREVSFSEEALWDFMKIHPKMALEEIRQAFRIKEKTEVLPLLKPMIENGKLLLVEAGNGWFVKVGKIDE